MVTGHVTYKVFRFTHLTKCWGARSPDKYSSILHESQCLLIIVSFHLFCVAVRRTQQNEIIKSYLLDIDETVWKKMKLTTLVWPVVSTSLNRFESVFRFFENCHQPHTVTTRVNSNQSNEKFKHLQPFPE